MKLTKRLLDKGYDVAGLTTSQHGKEKLNRIGIKAYIGNVLEIETLDQTIDDFRPDIIMHEITDLKQVDMSANTKVRIEGTKNLVDIAIKYNVRQIQSQSIAFAYEAGNDLATEETPLDYQSTGDRKITVNGVEGLEQETKRIDNHVILRYGLLYGPGTWYGKEGMIYNQFINGQVTITDGIQSFIHIDDAVEVAIQALNFEAGTYNVSDDEPTSRSAWAQWYADLLKVDPNIKVQTAAPFERGVNNFKFKQQGGTLQYTTWKDGMNPIF